MEIASLNVLQNVVTLFATVIATYFLISLFLPISFLSPLYYIYIAEFSNLIEHAASMVILQQWPSITWGYVYLFYMNVLLSVVVCTVT